MALLADVVAALSALLPQRTLSAPPSATGAPDLVPVPVTADTSPATITTMPAFRHVASLDVPSEDHVARKKHEQDLLVQLRTALEKILREYAQPQTGYCAARLAAAARDRMCPSAAAASPADSRASQRPRPTIRVPINITLMKRSRHRPTPKASTSKGAMRRRSSPLRSKRRIRVCNLPVPIPQKPPPSPSPIWALIGAAVAMAASHLPVSWTLPWGANKSLNEGHYKDKTRGVRFQGFLSHAAPYVPSALFPALTAILPGSLKMEEDINKEKERAKTRSAWHGEPVAARKEAVKPDAGSSQRHTPKEDSLTSAAAYACTHTFDEQSSVKKIFIRQITTSAPPGRRIAADSSLPRYPSPCSARQESWKSESPKADSSSSSICSRSSHSSFGKESSSGSETEYRRTQRERTPRSRSKESPTTVEWRPSAQKQSPECVVLYAPRNASRSPPRAQTYVRVCTRPQTAYGSVADVKCPPARAAAQAPGAHVREGRGHDKEREAKLAAKGAIVRTRRARSVGAQRKAAPEVLSGLPSSLLARILSRHFAGVEMAALGGACTPLERAGGFALRSALWHLRRDLDALTERMHYALRQAQSLVKLRGAGAGEGAGGGCYDGQQRAQKDARSLLVSLVLLEEARGELGVLSAHAGAWPRAGSGASARLVGLLAGCVLDDGRRLLKLLPCPNSQARPRPRVGGQRRALVRPSSPRPLELPPLAAGAAADAVCSVSARLSQILAAEAAAGAHGAAAAALGACALALLESCPCTDAMLVVTVGESSTAAEGGDARRMDTRTPGPGAPAPGGVQVLALYEVRGLEQPPPPWPPTPPPSTGSGSASRRPRAQPPPPPAGAIEATHWLRALGASVRKQRRQVALARFEMFGDPRRCAAALGEGAGEGGPAASAPARRSHLTHLPCGGERHLVERRWPPLAGLRDGGVRVMLELRCPREAAPPVLRSLLGAPPPPPESHPPVSPRAGVETMHPAADDEDAFAFFAWRAP